MWTRRVLLATVIAACAMSIPRHVTSGWNVALPGAIYVAAGSFK